MGDFCIIYWDCLNKIAILVTLVGIPSILILYFGIFKGVFKLLKYDKNKYISKRLKGKIVFDYSKNNGKYKLGSGEQFFELQFTKSSDQNIQIYTDPPSITGLTVVLGKYNIKDIKKASKYEMSSRVERPQTGELALFKNIQGNYCAIKILDIKDRTRSDALDEVTFEYVINSDNFEDFSN